MATITDQYLARRSFFNNVLNNNSGFYKIYRYSLILLNYATGLNDNSEQIWEYKQRRYYWYSTTSTALVTRQYSEI